MMVTTTLGLYASAANGIGTISLGQVSGERSPKEEEPLAVSQLGLR